MTLLDIESNWYFEFEDNCHASRGSNLGDLCRNFHLLDLTVCADSQIHQTLNLILKNMSLSVERLSPNSYKC